MATVSLEYLKRHVKVDDFSADDNFLLQELEEAEDFVVRYTNRSMDELIEMGGGSVPPSIRRAIVLLVSHYYEQPQGVSSGSMTPVPYGIDANLKPFRKLVDDAGREDEH